MKKNIFNTLIILLLLCATTAVMAQRGKPSYKITLKGYQTITALDCAMMPIGLTGGVVTITKNADGQDKQFQTDMKNQTKFATMEVVAYDASGKKTKTYHFTNLQVKSVVASPASKISSMGLSFDNMTQN